MNTNWLGGIALGAVLVLGAYVLIHTNPAINVNVPPGDQSQTQTYGSAGQDQYAFAQFLGGMVVGQGIIASSTSASVTLTGKEFMNADTLDYTVNVGSVTLTLPASTTPICSSIPKGARRAVFIRNATTTAASTITLAGGTGIKLKLASTTIIAGNTDGYNFAKLDIVRLQSSDCDALFTQFN